MAYSDYNFADLVDDKIGNVKFFKKVLREKGLIGARQQFTDEHRDYFEEVLDTKRQLHCTWETAIYKVLNDVVARKRASGVPQAAAMPTTSASDTTDELLRQILETLLRIERKLAS